MRTTATAAAVTMAADMGNTCRAGTRRGQGPGHRGMAGGGRQTGGSGALQTAAAGMAADERLMVAATAARATRDDGSVVVARAVEVTTTGAGTGSCGLQATNG